MRTIVADARKSHSKGDQSVRRADLLPCAAAGPASADYSAPVEEDVVVAGDHQVRAAGERVDRADRRLGIDRVEVVVPRQEEVPRQRGIRRDHDRQAAIVEDERVLPQRVARRGQDRDAGREFARDRLQPRQRRKASWASATMASTCCAGSGSWVASGSSVAGFSDGMAMVGAPSVEN